MLLPLALTETAEWQPVTLTGGLSILYLSSPAATWRSMWWPRSHSVTSASNAAHTIHPHCHNGPQRLSIKADMRNRRSTSCANGQESGTSQTVVDQCRENRSSKCRSGTGGWAVRRGSFSARDRLICLT